MKITGVEVLIFILIGLFVIALITSVVIIHNKNDSEVLGVITPEAYNNTQNVIYTSEDRKSLSNLTNSFFTNFLEQEESFKAFNGEKVIEIFEKSNISSEKALLFLSFVESNKEFTISKLMQKGFKVSLENDFLKQIPISPQDISKLAYNSFVILAGEDGSNYEILGQKGFNVLFTDVIYATTLLDKFLKSGGSLVEANILGEVLYQVGSDLDDLINEIGLDIIVDLLIPKATTSYFNEDTLLAIQSRLEGTETNIDNILENINTTRDILTTSEKAIKIGLKLFTNLCLTLPNNLFQNYYNYTKQTHPKEAYLGLSFIDFANGLSVAKALTYSELPYANDGEFINGLAYIFTENRVLENKFTNEDERTTYYNSIKSDLTKLFIDSEYIKDLAKGIEIALDYVRMQNENPNLNDKINSYIEHTLMVSNAIINEVKDFENLLIYSVGLELGVLLYENTIFGG